MKQFIYKKTGNSLGFLHFRGQKLLDYMRQHNIEPNDLWAEDNPLPHVILANEYFEHFEHLLNACSSQINPNLCDGNEFGNKSLLILLTLLVSNQSLVHEFLDIYKGSIDLDYQDSEGMTALHYAIILGRTDLVSQLLAAGASKTIQDKNYKYAEDYVFCEPYVIKRILKKIDIEPYRDINALNNFLQDHQQRPLMLQGVQMVQNQAMLHRALRAAPTLYLYIKEHEDLSPYVGDHTSSTHEEMLDYALRASQELNIPQANLFVKKRLGEQEQQQFQQKLRTLIRQFSGVTVLDRCLQGQNPISGLLFTHSENLPSVALQKN